MNLSTKTFFTFGALTAFIVIAGVFLINPRTTHAQAQCLSAKAAGEAQAASGKFQNVPVQDGLVHSNTYQQTQVQCFFNGLAQAMAKVALQKMTNDIVGWINSGFEGNPAFPTNPQAFFLDAVDAVSGEFLSHQGPLSQLLCSPFGLDIRLSVALNLNSYRSRYACTLSDIFANLEQGPRLSINGRSIDGFLAGDFYQGGWPGFIALTTSGSNDPYSTYLTAMSDVRAQIASRQTSLRADLSMGSGFLSWQKCDDIPEPDESYDAAVQHNTLDVRRVRNPNGTYKYQHCTTQTPGSVIGASLNKSLGSSVDQIVNIHDIDQAVSQVASALIFKTLQTGLAAASKSGSDPEGSGRSLMAAETFKETRDQLGNKLSNILADIEDALVSTNNYATLRMQAYNMVVAERTNLTNAAACLAAKGDSRAQELAVYMLNRRVNQTVEEYQSNIGTATSTLTTAQIRLLAFQDEVLSATSTDQLPSLARKRSTILGADDVYTAGDVRRARNALADAQGTASAWHAKAVEYQGYCNAIATTTAATL